MAPADTRPASARSGARTGQQEESAGISFAISSARCLQSDLPQEVSIMGNVNKVILIGNLGADPELKRTPANRPYCHLRLATSQVFKDTAGQRQERTEWHRITVWGETAEHCARFLGRGRPLYVEGRLESRQWEDQQGHKRNATDVVASRVVFLGSKDGQAGQGGGGKDGRDLGDEAPDLGEEISPRAA
jgi:single-strand DNA-binding protein